MPEDVILLKFYTLFSGSSGNSAFVRFNDTRVLIDCGVSSKRITEALASIGESQVDAILITHEHSDHTSGLRVFSRKISVPVYATAPTWESPGMFSLEMPLFNKQIAVPGVSFSVQDIDVTPFSTSHDCAHSVGYTLNCGGVRFAIATDNGKITCDFAENLRGCDTALIEANYDTEMLQKGPYPYHLKQRIASEVGHMSNDQAAKLACALARSGTKRIILGHLSKENNTPETAYETVHSKLCEEGLSPSLKVAARYEVTNLLD